MMQKEKIEINPSEKTGAHHWLMQRISALALLFIGLWLILSIMTIASDPKNILPIFFSYPLNVLMGILFISFALYHGSLGMKVIIEDYINHKFKRHFYVIVINFLSITSGVAAILAILHLHLIN